MAKFTHVLVAACPGFLEVPVLKRAARFAEANNAKLTVLDVVEPIEVTRYAMANDCDMVHPGRVITDPRA